MTSLMYSLNICPCNPYIPVWDPLQDVCALVGQAALRISLNVYICTVLLQQQQLPWENWGGWFWKVKELSEWGIWVEAFGLVFMEKKGMYIFSDFALGKKLFSLRCYLFSFERIVKPMQTAEVAETQKLWVLIKRKLQVTAGTVTCFA